MKQTHKLTHEQKQEVVSLYGSGLSQAKIAHRFSLTKGAIQGILRRRGVKSRSLSEACRRYSIDEAFFERIDTQEKAYFLGFLYGDGAMNPADSNVHTVGLVSDQQIFEDMRKAIRSERPLRIDKRGYMIFTFAGKRLKRDLLALGVIPNKTKTLSFPDKHMPSVLYRHFIRGLFDSDGSITLGKDKRCNRFAAHWTISSTRRMLKKVKTIMKQVNIQTNELTRDKRCFSESAILGTCKCESLFRIYDFLYEGETICLKRKKMLFERVLTVKPRMGLVASRREQIGNVSV